MEKKNKIQKIKKENNQLVNQKKLESQLDRLLEGQEINRELIYKGFIGLAQQNQELVESNKELTQKLEILVEELPPYAPQLNPEEYCHGNVKQRLKNARPESKEEICSMLDRGFSRLRRRPDLLIGFFHTAGLSVRQLRLT